MKNKGFTLIEILVSISIIGIITVLMTVSFKVVKEKVRDAKRKSDFAYLSAYLGIYYSRFAKYPCGDTNVSSETWDTSLASPFLNGGTPTNCASNPKYGLYGSLLINELQPKDPLNSGTNFYSYKVSLNRQQYILYAPLENDKSAMKSDGGLCENYYEVGPGLGSITPYVSAGMPSCNLYNPYSQP